MGGAILRKLRALVLAASAGFLILSLFLWATPARAGTITYAYSGNEFKGFAGLACPPNCAISGSFTLDSALGDNFKGDIKPASFSFTDGSLIISSASKLPPLSFFFVDTNGSGAITQWDIFLQLKNGDTLLTSNYGLLILDGVDVTGRWKGIDFAGNVRDAGTWSSTPEPSALLLLGISLLGVVTLECSGLFPSRRKRSTCTSREKIPAGC